MHLHIVNIRQSPVEGLRRPMARVTQSARGDLDLIGVQRHGGVFILQVKISLLGVHSLLAASPPITESVVARDNDFR